MNQFVVSSKSREEEEAGSMAWDLVLEVRVTGFQTLVMACSPPGWELDGGALLARGFAESLGRGFGGPGSGFSFLFPPHCCRQARGPHV